MLPDGATPLVGKNGEDLAVKFEQEGVYGVKCLPHHGICMVLMVGAPANLDQVKDVPQVAGRRRCLRRSSTKPARRPSNSCLAAASSRDGWTSTASSVQTLCQALDLRRHGKRSASTLPTRTLLSSRSNPTGRARSGQPSRGAALHIGVTSVAESRDRTDLALLLMRLRFGRTAGTARRFALGPSSR